MKEWDGGTAREVAQQESLRSAISWYFSPYLTSLVTVPMLGIMVVVACIALLRLIGRSIGYVIRWPWLLLIGPVGLPLSILHLALIYQAIISIPKTWQRNDQSVIARALVIGAYSGGSCLFCVIWDTLQVLLGRWILGL